MAIQLLDGGFGGAVGKEHPRGIARQDTQDHEDQQGDAEQRERRLPDTPDDVGPHAARRPRKRARDFLVEPGLFSETTPPWFYSALASGLCPSARTAALSLSEGEGFIFDPSPPKGERAG